MATSKDPFNKSAGNPQQTGTSEIKLSDGRDFGVKLHYRATGELNYVLYFKSAEDFAEQARTTFLHPDTMYYDLSGMDLQGVDFSSCAGLKYAVFDGSDLSGADFSNAEIDNASFRNCNMTGTNLRAAKAEEADFSGSKLVDASLRSTWAAAANFFNADLTGAETHMLNLRKAHLEFARISKEQLAKAMFSEQSSRMTASMLIARRIRPRAKQLNRR